MPSSIASSHDEALDTPGDNPTTEQSEELLVTSSLEELQTDEQRRVLDTVAQVRKCGLESILSLPQLVVCGDQSAGKSSVLEALTEIPFPRNDNLCTRHPTEIILRRGPTNLLTVKVIPGGDRPQHEQEKIKAFEETISDFADLPAIMEKAMAVMGISKTESSEARAFAQDVLSIEIEGPTRPQLTLVDIPGLIQTSTKGVSDADVDLVAEITDRYIKQPRTICLAVVAATSDAANQAILRKVRQVDPEGNRTLGIITKPDRLPKGSGSEAKFVELARNQDVFFKLGWHVLRNRCFEEGTNSLMQRNMAEKSFFRDPKSAFSSLPKDNVGIDALRSRLSVLLFDHVKQELPKLRQDLETALVDAQNDLALLGDRRSKPRECRAYLSQLSLNYFELCKAAVNGHYESGYFTSKTDEEFSVSSPTTIRRLRAVVQYLNSDFAEIVHKNGHKYWIDTDESDEKKLEEDSSDDDNEDSTESGNEPVTMTRVEALKWVEKTLVRTRGKELVGSFNPLLIGELFWEQSSKWPEMAKAHIEEVANICQVFLDHLFSEKCPKDVKGRIWSAQILDKLKQRRKAALNELDLIVEDLQSFPINYNHYYTDTIHKLRLERQKAALSKAITGATTTEWRGKSCEIVDVPKAMELYNAVTDPSMEHFSCEEALESLLAIYKVSQKTFIANITIQVIERHIVRGLEGIFSPIVASNLSDAEAQAIASEPTSAKRQREFLEDRIARLENGQDIFRGVMSGAIG